MAYRSVRYGELVPELGGINGVPVRGMGEEAAAPVSAWGSFIDTIGKVVDVGGSIYDKYVDTDTRDAQLEIAKLQAKTEAEKTAIQRLQAEIAARPTIAAGIGVGTLALLAGGGVLAYMLLSKRRR